MISKKESERREQEQKSWDEMNRRFLRPIDYDTLNWPERAESDWGK